MRPNSWCARHVHPDVQVARLASRRRRARRVAAQPDARAVLDAGRDLHLEPPRAPLGARAVTGGARRLDDPAGALALRARLRHLEEALVHRRLRRSRRTRDT